MRQFFFEKLYAVYSASPKNKAELEAIALQLSIRLNSIEREREHLINAQS
jgi:hypothetical protein